MALCLGLAGLVLAQLPASTFTLAWQHSVEKVLWEEDYQLAQGHLHLVQARVKGSGAGMEIPAGAVLVAGAWHYVPPLPPLGVLRLGRAAQAGDYQVCVAGDCAPMAHWLGPPVGEPVDLWMCAAD